MENILKKALIIDDEQEICILIEQILKMKNITSQSTYSISKTFSILEHYTPDIIFLDHRLPDGYGFEFIERLRTKCPLAKIVGLSAQYDYIKESTLCTDADVFIKKPFAVDQIFKILDTFNNKTN